MVEKLVYNFEDSEIIKLLEEEFGANKRQAQELLAGMHDAIGYHEEVGPSYYSEITINEYRANIQTAHDAIRILNASLNNLPHLDRLLIDDYYREANDSDTLMIDLGDKIMLETVQLESGFQQVSQRMQNALNLAEKNIRTSGAGNARRQAREYMAAIEMLARWFADVFPNNKISAVENTLFYRYVMLWLKCFTKKNWADKDIRRHISNALNHPNVRLNHVKG